MTEKRFMQHGKIIDIYFQHKQLAKITKLLLFIIDHGDTKVRYTGIFQWSKPSIEKEKCQNNKSCSRKEIIKLDIKVEHDIIVGKYYKIDHIACHHQRIRWGHQWLLGTSLT